jgi:hypothetical protein
MAADDAGDVMRVNAALLDKPIKIHVCKDRTLSYRNIRQPVFNGVAILVFSTDTVGEARRLIKLVSSRQYVEHPLIPGDPWYKVTLGLKTELEYEDLGEVQARLSDAYELVEKGY